MQGRRDTPRPKIWQPLFKVLVVLFFHTNSTGSSELRGTRSSSNRIAVDKVLCLGVRHFLRRVFWDASNCTMSATIALYDSILQHMDSMIER
jgi:hypothetical protein